MLYRGQVSERPFQKRMTSLLSGALTRGVEGKRSRDQSAKVSSKAQHCVRKYKSLWGIHEQAWESLTARSRGPEIVRSQSPVALPHYRGTTTVRRRRDGNVVVERDLQQQGSVSERPFKKSTYQRVFIVCFDLDARAFEGLGFGAGKKGG